MKKIIIVCFGLFIISNIYFHNSANAAECYQPKISAPGYWPGFVSVNTEGKQTGKAFEIAEQILSPLMGDLIVDMHKPWARILKELEIGNIDIVVGMLKSKDRLKKFIFTDPWMSSEWGVITLDHTVVQWTGVNSLDGLLGGYVNGLKLPPEFEAYLHNNSMVRAVNSKEILNRMLLAGRIDYFFENKAHYELEMKPKRQNSKVKFIDESLTTLDVHMAISRQSPCSKDIHSINKAIRNWLSSK